MTDCTCNNFPGSLGIGIGAGAIPNYRVHVAGTQPEIAIENSGSNRLWTLWNYKGATSTLDGFGLVDRSTQPHAFRWFVDAGGRFGLGTTVPQNRVHVVGTHPDLALENTAAGGRKYTLIGQATTGPTVNGFGLRDDSQVPATFRWFVSALGYMGIGTHEPLDVLHVSGSDPGVSLTNAPDGQRYALKSQVAPDSGIGLRDENQGLFRWYVNAYGRVGVGTTTPGARLHVVNSNGAGERDGATMLVASPTADTQTLLGFRAADQSRWFLGSRNGYLAGGDRFAIIGTAPTEGERLTILQGGNVGIGRTDPQLKLHVQGSMRAEGDVAAAGQLTGTGIGVGSGTMSGGTVQANVVTAGNYVGVRTTAPTYPLDVVSDVGADASELLVRFRRSDSDTPPVANVAGLGATGFGKTLLLYAGTGAAKMQVGSNGSVVMGTGSPESRLTIFSNVEGQLIRFVQTDNNSPAGIGATAAGKGLTFYTGALDQERMRIDQFGNVGIGTTVVSARLHVQGGEIVWKGDPAQGQGRVSAREFFVVTPSDGRTKLADSNGDVFGAVYG